MLRVSLVVPVKLIPLKLVDRSMSLTILDNLARGYSENTVVQIVRVWKGKHCRNMLPGTGHQVLDEVLSLFSVPCLVAYWTFRFVKVERRPSWNNLPALHELQRFKTEIINVELPSVDLLLPLLMETNHTVRLSHLMTVTSDDDPGN